MTTKIRNRKYPKGREITFDVLREDEKFKDLTDEQVHQAVQTIRELAWMMYDNYMKFKKDQLEKESESSKLL